jgi:hypothetical protein
VLATLTGSDATMVICWTVSAGPNGGLMDARRDELSAASDIHTPRGETGYQAQRNRLQNR